MSETSEQLETRIAAYIDGELSPAEAARLEVFLANTDPQLAEQIIGMLDDRHRLRSLPRGVAPADLAGRVLEQVERASLLNDVETAGQGRRPWWQSRRLGAVAALLMVGAFTYFVITTVAPPRHNKQIDKILSSTAKPAGGAAAREEEKDRAKDAVPGGTGPAAVVMEKTAGTGGAGGTMDKDSTALAMGKEGPAGLEPRKGGLGGGRNADVKTAELVETGVQEQLLRQRDIALNGTTIAKKYGYTSVDSPSKALSSISVGSALSGRDPVVLTLVARDDRDYMRLQQFLVDLINQDPALARRQMTLQTRFANGTNTLAFANQAAANGATNGAASRPTSQYAATGAINQVADNAGKNKAEQQLNKSVGNYDGNTNLNNNNDQMYQVYNSGQQRFDAVSEGNTAALNAGNSDNGVNATGQAQPQAAATAGEKSQAGVGQQTQAGVGQQTQAAGERGNWEAGPPFRVELRPEQLQRLAAQFQVNSVTCGQQAFVIAGEPNGAPARGAAGRDNAEHLKAQSKAEPPPAKADELTQHAPGVRMAPSPAAAAAPEAGTDHRREVAAAKSAAGPAQTTVPSPPAAAALRNGFETTGRDGQWLECVITMQPQQAKAAVEAPATRAATQHSK